MGQVGGCGDVGVSGGGVLFLAVGSARSSDDDNVVLRKMMTEQQGHCRLARCDMLLRTLLCVMSSRRIPPGSEIVTSLTQPVKSSIYTAWEAVLTDLNGAAGVSHGLGAEPFYTRCTVLWATGCYVVVWTISLLPFDTF